jgi:hypothetical protein
MSQKQALRFRRSLPPNSSERACINEFIQCARGYENPMSKTEWCDRMAELGVLVSKFFLEQRIIRPARQSYDFLGVRRYRGLYLMITRQDIEKSAEFYHSQGESMNARGDQLIARLGANPNNNSRIELPLLGFNTSCPETVEPTSIPLLEFCGDPDTTLDLNQNTPSIP